MSRPLPASAALGAMLGDVEAGLMIGLVFELFHLSGASLGGVHPDHETLPAIQATALASTVGLTEGASSTPALWSLAILLCAPSGAIGRWVDLRLDARAKRYWSRAAEAAKSGGLAAISRQTAKAMWPHFAFYGTAAATAIPLAALAGSLLPLLPPAILRGLAWSYPALGLVSAGIAIHARGQEHLVVVAGVAVAVAALLLVMVA